MTFDPVLPAAVLIVVAALIVALRALSVRRAGRLRWSVLTAAMLLLVVAAARPAFGGGASLSSEDGGVNVFFVVDRSAALRVQDFGDGTSRMAGIRDDMAALVDQHPGARFAVISFASTSDLSWPLSEDVWSLQPMIAGLSSYPATSPEALFEANAAAGSDILRYELQQAAEQFPGSKNLVFYFGSGAGGSRAPQGAFDLGSATVAGGAVLGYGTPAGGPVPAEMINGQVAYLTDTPGAAPLPSAIDEPRLTAIADQLGVPYVHSENGQSITTALPAVGDSQGSASRSAQRVELYWVFSLAAAALLLAEIYLTIRRHRRNRVVRQEVEQ